MVAGKEYYKPWRLVTVFNTSSITATTVTTTNLSTTIIP
jgi:hypothetical protein